VTSYKVYVTGLKDDVDNTELDKYFSEFGAVESVDVVVDRETRQSRGFAFVSFSDYDPVDKIVCKFCWFAQHSPCVTSLLLYYYHCLSSLDSILRFLQSLITQECKLIWVLNA